MMFGVTLGKRLEVLGDGAKWIDLWLAGVRGMEIERILCWYHLCRRVYESLSGLGWEKQKKKAFERLILGALWEGKVSQADGDCELFGAKRAWFVDREHSGGKVERLVGVESLQASRHELERPGRLSQSLYASEKRTPRLDPVSAN